MIFGMSFGNVFFISLVLSLASYIIGDLIVLPRTNNTFATAADFGLAFLVIWFMVENVTYGSTVVISLLAAAGVSLFEVFFHRFLAKNRTDTREVVSQQRNSLQFQTETAEEFTPVRPDVRSPEDEDNR